MIDNDFAAHFAADWVDSWNAHDLDRVLAHYADDFEMSSPLIAMIAEEPRCILRGKAVVREYWRKALVLMPELRFELRLVLAGVDSITLHYAGPGTRLSAEVLHFGADRKVTRAFAHYAI